MMQRMRRVPAALAVLAGMVAAPLFAQGPPPPYPPQQQPYPPQQGYPPPQAYPPPPVLPPQALDQLVSRIALYPDPLLAQILAAATYPNDIPAAAQWADQHHYLTGQALGQRHHGGPVAVGSQRAGAAAVSVRAGHDECGHELDLATRQRVSGPATGRDGCGAAAARHRATLRLSAEQWPGAGERRAVHYDHAGESGVRGGSLL